MSRIIAIPLLAVALAACGSSYRNEPTTTTSAQLRTPPRSPAPSPSPPPWMEPTAPEQTVIDENANPPPQLNMTPLDLSTTEIVQGTDARDRHIKDALETAIKSDNTLSATAKDVEVIANSRKVILKGKAKTERERMDIDTKARAFEGVIDVDDRIELSP